MSAAASGGKGATVAIIGVLDPSAASDLARYRSQYKLPACTITSGCLRKVNENGQASPLPPAATGDPSWAEGESVDMDMVSAICPSCHVLLVEAVSDVPFDTGAAVDAAVSLGAKYVIAGVNSGVENSTNDATYYDHPGVAIVAAAGDRGFDGSGTLAQMDDYPAESPFVTTVGGTTLRRASNARGWTETVWGSTSSGCSPYFGKPSWEKDAGCAGRTTNDVAAVADPATGVAFYDTAEDAGGWQVGGGTTVSASIVGAVYALAGVPGTGTIPASFPSAHTAGLNRVTSGSDGSCAPAYLCTAGPGYNGPAGWGTPNGTAAFRTPSADAVAMVNPGAQNAYALPETVNLQIDAGDSAGHPLTYSATGLPPGVSIDPATGLISGTVTTNYSAKVTVTASDADTASGTVSFDWDAHNDFFISSPVTLQTEPDTQVSFQASYYEPDKSATLTFSATGLPPGLAIDQATGVISGTTNSTIASYQVTLSATDSDGTSSTLSRTWNVWNLITVTATDYEQASIGAPVSVPVSATDSATGSTLTFSATGLPPGLAIDPATGTISGTPTAFGYSRTTVTVTDGPGSEGTARITWLVLDVVTLGGVGAQETRQGHPAELGLKVSHRDPGDPMRYTATGLPPGITVDLLTPVISGFPTTAGTYHVSVTAYGLDGGSATDHFTWTVPSAPTTGPAGQVRLGSPYDNLCLDDAGNSSVTGATIRIQTCDGKAEQRWTYTLGGELRIHGKCLSIAGNPKKAGTGTELELCTGAATQQWAIQSYSWLTSLASGLCLSDPDKDAIKTGERAVIDLCGFSPSVLDIYTSQQWELPAGPVLSGIPGRCLDVYRGERTPGAKIDLASCDGGKAQAWSFDPGDQTVRIFGLCLTRTTEYGTEGSHLTLRKCTYANPRQWWDLASAWTNFTSNIGAGQARGAAHSYGLAAPANLTANPALMIMSSASGPGSAWHIW